MLQWIFLKNRLWLEALFEIYGCEKHLKTKRVKRHTLFFSSKVKFQQWREQQGELDQQHALKSLGLQIFLSRGK